MNGYGREATTGLVVPDDLAVEERLPPRAPAKMRLQSVD
jgi:hypothetical protein